MKFKSNLKKYISIAITAIIVSTSINTSFAQTTSVQKTNPVESEIVTNTSNIGQKQTIQIKERSKQEIIDMAEKLYHSGLGGEFDKNKRYLQAPSTTYPYKAGQLTNEYLKDALNAVNMVRYIAGFPTDIALNSHYTDLIQHGATLLGAIDKLTHYPEKPSNMSQDFYSKGSKGTQSSNLAGAWGYNGNYTLAKSIVSYMDDSDAYNIDRLGHRRWLLSTSMKYVGFGYAQNTKGAEYSGTYVFDRSRAENIDYEHITWPSKGVFPVEYFDATQAWSISLNPNKYQAPVKNNVKVQVTRLNDNKSWTLNSSVPDSNKNSSTASYFNVNNGGYGDPNCIIFRPGNIGTIKKGDKFKITISGIKKKDGTSTTINYDVEFFGIDGSFNDIKNHWAEDAIRDFMDAGHISGYTDGTFRPNNSITRAEFVSIMNSYFGLTKSSGKVFSDTRNHWAKIPIDIAVTNGIASGVTSTQFKPNDPITREQASVMIANYKNISDRNFDKLSRYKDAYKVSSWAKPAVEGILERNYMSGYSDNTFRPKNNITRAEAIVTLTRVK